jgi:hypothetical protein
MSSQMMGILRMCARSQHHRFRQWRTRTRAKSTTYQRPNKPIEIIYAESPVAKIKRLPRSINEVSMAGIASPGTGHGASCAGGGGCAALTMQNRLNCSQAAIILHPKSDGPRAEGQRRRAVCKTAMLTLYRTGCKKGSPRGSE